MFGFGAPELLILLVFAVPALIIGVIVFAVVKANSRHPAVTPSAGAPPGWHPDPDGTPGQLRYWVGAAWTEQRASST
jgi:hypothetical protein